MESVRIIGASRKRSEIIDQEIPDLEKAILRARHSQTESDFPHAQQQHQQRGGGGDPHAAAAVASCCTHLRKILPDELDLEFVTTAHDGFFIKNPVHALHLESQFDPKEDITDWLVYGEEQERALAFTTPGIVETWSSTVKNDHYPEESNQKSFRIASNEGADETARSLVPSQVGAAPPSPTVGCGTPTSATITAPGTPPSIQDERKIQEEQYKHYAQAEEEIRRLRQVLIGRRKLPGNTKRPKLKVEGPTPISQEAFQDYKETQRYAIGKANRILETYRQQRRNYWSMQEPPPAKLFGQIDDAPDSTTLRCHKCSKTNDLRRCLECSFVGCSEQHSFTHYLTTQHEFGTSKHTCTRARTHNRWSTAHL
jgi:hypothetical protein